MLHASGPVWVMEATPVLHHSCTSLGLAERGQRQPVIVRRRTAVGEKKAGGAESFEYEKGRGQRVGRRTIVRWATIGHKTTVTSMQFDANAEMFGDERRTTNDSWERAVSGDAAAGKKLM
jgi:hypothetical protein